MNPDKAMFENTIARREKNHALRSLKAPGGGGGYAVRKAMSVIKIHIACISCITSKVSLFLTPTPEHTDAFVPSWHGLENSMAVKILH
jgi:hypothetical protein